MSLEEEIAIIQFAQAIHSDERLLAHFGQLDEEKQRMQFMELSFLVWQIKPTKADMAQARVDSSLDDTYVTGTTLVTLSMRVVNMGRSDRDTLKEFAFLLYVYKAAYQRCFASEISNSSNWLYQDLLKPEIVQTILDEHRSLVERVFVNTSFRSEFATLARLWKRTVTQETTYEPDPTPVQREKFAFLNYFELIDYPLDVFICKHSQGIGLLCDALANALVIQFRVTDKQARRLIQDVVARHGQVDDGPGLS